MPRANHLRISSGPMPRSAQANASLGLEQTHIQESHSLSTSFPIDIHSVTYLASDFFRFVRLDSNSKYSACSSAKNNLIPSNFMHSSLFVGRTDHLTPPGLISTTNGASQLVRITSFLPSELKQNGSTNRSQNGTERMNLRRTSSTTTQPFSVRKAARSSAQSRTEASSFHSPNRRLVNKR